jgi:hypothetical protein
MMTGRYTSTSRITSIRAIRPGDSLPEIDPFEPVFENYYPQNYTMAESGMFVGLEPLGDFEAKTARVFAALAQARRAEVAQAPSSRASAMSGASFSSTARPMSLP